MNSQGVFTLKRRVKFVEKTIADVGDGTPYPTEVLFDMIAEIYVRAKTVEWAGGEITTFWDDSDLALYPDQKVTIVAPSSPPTPATPNHQFEVDAYDNLQWYYTRGYSAIESVTAYAEDYLGESYEAYDVGYRRDIDINERAMWLPEFTNSPTVCTNAFSYDSKDNISSGEHVVKGYGLYLGSGGGVAYFPLDFSVVFSGEIAVVLSAPGASFWGAGNTYYLGVRVRTANAATSYSLTGTFGFEGLDTVASTFPNPIHCGNYVMRLANGMEVSSKLYTEETIGLDTVGSIGDLVHEVTEWWPYATGENTFGRVWESETGVKIPDGAGHADAGDPDETLAIYSFF